MKRLIILCVVALIAIAGCGGDDEGDSVGGGAETPATESTPAETTEPADAGVGEKLTLAADKSQLKFDKTELSAPAGPVTIAMDNPSPLPHNVAIKGGGVDEKGDVVGQGEQSTVTTELKAGSYTFYCSVAGHESAGMKGTLTVN